MATTTQGVKIIYIGGSFTDVLQLRTQNPTIPSLINPFLIETGSLVEVLFPNDVVLSTANVGEVTVNDANLSTITYLGDPAKSALFTPSGKNLSPLDVRVTQGISGEVVYFEATGVLNIIKPANTPVGP